MKFTEIEIPVYVLDKLAWKHHVNEQEVRQALRNRPKVRFWQRGRYERKDLYLALGQTDAGRYLSVFFIRKEKGTAYIISARDMDQKERRMYGKK
jgi:uncharacterized protein